MKTIYTRLTRTLLALTLLVAQAGCLLGPDFVSPAAPPVRQYTREPVSMTGMGDQDQDQEQPQLLLIGADPPAQWWRLFGSPALNAAVDRALTQNPTLQAAVSNLRAAQDNLRAGNGLFYPQLDTAMKLERNRSAPALQGSLAPASVFNVATLEGSISYALDLFGGRRRTVEQLGALVDVQQQLRDAAYLTLTANVVNTCIARAGYLSQIRLTEQIIALEQQQLLVIQARVKAGIAPFADQLAQASLLAGNQALLVQLKQRLSQAEHLLAQLQGDFPADVVVPAVELDDLHLPAAIPVSLPSSLVRRRPDILAAEARLHAASAAIGISSAAQYPSLDLTASYGLAARGLSPLAGASAPFWSIGPSLSAPLFHGGSLQAQRDAAVNAFEASQAQYRQTVLAAFAQVADALRALQADGRVLEAQSEAERDARDTLALQQASYSAGLASYVDLLTFDMQYHNAAIARLQTLTLRYQDTVSLLAASGGGWDGAPSGERRDPAGR